MSYNETMSQKKIFLFAHKIFKLKILRHKEHLSEQEFVEAYRKSDFPRIKISFSLHLKGRSGIEGLTIALVQYAFIIWTHGLLAHEAFQYTR